MHPRHPPRRQQTQVRHPQCRQQPQDPRASWPRSHPHAHVRPKSHPTRERPRAKPRRQQWHQRAQHLRALHSHYPPRRLYPQTRHRFHRWACCVLPKMHQHSMLPRSLRHPSHYSRGHHARFSVPSAAARTPRAAACSTPIRSKDRGCTVAHHPTPRFEREGPFRHRTHAACKPLSHADATRACDPPSRGL